MAQSNSSSISRTLFEHKATIGDRVNCESIKRNHASVNRPNSFEHAEECRRAKNMLGFCMEIYLFIFRFLIEIFGIYLLKLNDKEKGND